MVRELAADEGDGLGGGEDVEEAGAGEQQELVAFADRVELDLGRRDDEQPRELVAPRPGRPRA